MTLSAGGVVNADFGGIDGINSSVLVTDAGSVWNSHSNLTLAGSGARLQIVNGGVVAGLNSSLEGDHGLVTISDAHSMLTNSGDLTVGYVGSNNGLLLTNRGTVFSGNGYLGVSHLLLESQGNANYGTTVYPFKGVGIGDGNDGGMASSNSAVVTGNGTVWNVSSNLSVGRMSSGYNSLTIANGGTVNSLNGFVGDTGWGVTFEGNPVTGSYEGYSDHNAATVTGSGSVWNNTGYLIIGNTNASYNSLTIANQGTVNSASGVIGANTGANSNSVLVTDSGSAWNLNFVLTVGSNGIGNTMTVANHGTVSANFVDIGEGSNANFNSLTVTGAGSLSNRLNVNVGGMGSSNSLMIADSGTVVTEIAGAGYGTSSRGNSITVDAGSLMASDTIIVGIAGSGNQMTVSNGGFVTSTSATIGSLFEANTNTASVSGAGARWNVVNDVTVGHEGSGNALNIKNGGRVLVGGNLNISAAYYANGNSVNINNGTLTVSNGTITVGTTGGSGSFNLNGGTVYGQKLVANSGHDSEVTFTKGYMDLLQATVEKESAMVVGDGTQTAHLNLRGGVSSFADGLKVANNSIVTGFGSTTNGDVLIQTGGTLSPGNGSTLGTFDFSGKLTLNGTETIKLDNGAGSGAGTFGIGDFVAVGGLLDLNGGSIDFTMLSAPVNEVYVFSSYSSLTGLLSATNNVPNGYVFETNYVGNELALVMIPEPVSASLLLLFGGGAMIFRRMRRWKSWHA